MRSIDQFKFPRAQTDLLKDPNIRKLLDIIRVAVCFSIDTIDFQWYMNSQKGESPKIEAHDLGYLKNDLTENFFSKIYVSRPEEHDIKSDIETPQVIGIKGLTGSGKTTLLLNLGNSLKTEGYFFFYLDFNIIHRHMYEKEINYIHHAYDTIYDDYILKEHYPKEYLAYSLCKDSNYASIRQSLAPTLTRYDFSKYESCLEFVNNASEIDETKSISTKNLATLLNFVREINDKKAVVCFDNLDHLPYDKLLGLIKDINDIQPNTRTPMLFSIRERNVSMLLKDISKEYGLYDLQNKHNLINKLEDIRAISPLNEFSLGSVLEKRLNFLKEHETWSIIFDMIDTSHPFLEVVKDEKENYINHFRTTFEKLATIMVKHNISDYCNHSIREMQALYFNFINLLLLQRTTDQNYWEVNPTKSELINTKLRNSFYRYLLANENDYVPPNYPQIDIFSEIEKPRMLHLKVLLAISNLEKKEKRLTFKRLSSALECLGVNRKRLRDVLLNLSYCSPEMRNELALVSIDTKYNEDITDVSRITLLPAGTFFLDWFVRSREYLFWNALYFELPEGVRFLPNDRYTLDDTFSDSIKLETVAAFFKLCLIPALRFEMENIEENVTRPDDWEYSKYLLYCEYFTYHREETVFFEEHALLSVKNSISNAAISPEEEKKFLDMYDDLIKAVREILQSYIE